MEPEFRESNNSIQKSETSDEKKFRRRENNYFRNERRINYNNDHKSMMENKSSWRNFDKSKFTNDVRNSNHFYNNFENICNTTDYVNNQMPLTSNTSHYNNHNYTAYPRNNYTDKTFNRGQKSETKNRTEYSRNITYNNQLMHDTDQFRQKNNVYNNSKAFSYGNQSNARNHYNRSYENARRCNNRTSTHKRSNNFMNMGPDSAKLINSDISKLEQRELLIHELNLGHYECMICMNVIQKDASVWSCDKCYHIFHLNCINKWALSTDKKQNVTEENQCWRCPACQNESGNVITTKLFYSCFCGKQMNPTFKQGTTPHSCGDVCSRTNQSNIKCKHLCSLQCHPGPCPPCEASVTRPCHCGRTKITAKCIADDNQFQCQSICEQTMQCGLHKCDKHCHIDHDGHKCQIKIEQICWCGSSNRSVLCGSIDSMVKSYECGNVCGRIKNCGNHKCEWSCHEGDCEECELMPNKVNSCYCGKKVFDQLHLDRQSCLDPIPSCNEVCGKKYPRCEHLCTNICHGGLCNSCPEKSIKKCRCGLSDQLVNCASNEVVMCKQRCKEKLLCGRHRCDKQCCDSEVHVCLMECGRQLSCKEHRCDRECGHPGSCPSCPNVSFEELFCECGVSFSLPPIACGQVAPLCTRPCSRDHPCEHPVRHNCHTESVCPPCTELVSKPCPGGHKEYANVPCFRPVATCGTPCGAPLPRCSHMCIKPCHSGSCVDSEEERCTQPCVRPRSECNHPCNAPCHPDTECDQVMGKCTKELTLSCECTLRSSLILCDKLRSITIMLRSDKTGTNSAVDVTLSDKDGRPYLTCNSDCKKAARNCRMAEAFTGAPVPLTLLHTFYPDSVKDFGVRHKGYVVSVQNVLVRLHNSLLNSNNATVTDSINVATGDQANFVQRYSDCFRMKWHCVQDQRPRATAGAVIVVIEACRGVARVPKPLLTEVLREKYPHLFVDDAKDDSKKDKPVSTVALASLSFADRLKLNTK